MKLAERPFWQAGFRPFFTLAVLAGMGLPVVWTLLFSGALTPPSLRFSAVQWHAHEMFYGFGWAVLGGFLLTSTKSWVKIRGYHGNALVLLTVAWITERAGMWVSGSLPPLLLGVVGNAFLISITVMLLWTLLRHRATDSYRAGNLMFFAVLPSFLLAKNLLLSESYAAIGIAMTLALFRLVFLIMLERTITQFMRSAFQVDIMSQVALDRAIKLLALALVFGGFFSADLAAAIELMLALLLLFRLARWKPLLAMRRLDIAVMYLGYLALVAQLLVAGVGTIRPTVWVGSVSVHIFTLGVMGLIVPAMIIRICKGHTGRKVIFDRGDKLALCLMLAAFALRIIAPQYAPLFYLRWIEAAAACWFVGFALLGWRYVPLLIRPRVDGRPG